MNEPSKCARFVPAAPPSLPPSLLSSLPSKYRCDEHGRGVHPQGVDQFVVGPVGNVDEEGQGVRDVSPVPVGEGRREEGGESDLDLLFGGEREG